MDVEFVKTQKGKDALVFEDYKYCLQRKNLNGTSAWRCSKYWTRNCRAAVLVDEGRVKSKTQGKLIMLC